MKTLDILQKAMLSLQGKTPEEVKAIVKEKGIVVPKETQAPSDDRFMFDLHGLFNEAINTHKVGWVDLFPDRQRKSVIIENKLKKGFSNEALCFF